jgi:hypothetical protein
VKSEPAAGAAVNVTVIPLAYSSEQSVPHSIPDGFEVTVPPPSPVVPTVSMKYWSSPVRENTPPPWVPA